jgi:ATP-dependent Clp protease adaptor protein ClpS
LIPTRRDTSPAASAVPDRRPRGHAPPLLLGGHRPPLQEVAASNPGTETSPDIDVEEKLKDAFTRGWSVIVWNDPINLMDYVVYIFKSVLKMNEQDASRHMWEVHQKGKSVVARETRERSELIVHRLRAFGLNATLEKA